jgi:uncharacterized protein
MLIEDSFAVHVPVDRLWTILQDVEAIAPCMPGAELTRVVDERTWMGRVRVRFGPVQLTFSGKVVIEELDDVGHRARLSARGTEQRGKGAASASVASWLEPRSDGATTVRIHSDITLTGAVAQLSRGLLPEVSRLLTKQFAECLREMLMADRPGDSGTTGMVVAVEAGTSKPTDGDTTTAAPRAVGGLGLGLRAIWATIVRHSARVFSRFRR